MRPKMLVAGVLIAGTAMFAGGALSPLGARRSEAVAPAGSIEPGDVLAPAGVSARSAVDSLEVRIDSDGRDPKLHAQLGLAYLQRARDDADPSNLPPAESALQESLRLQPDENLDAFVGMAALANARHDFSGSVKWSRKAIATNPYNASAYGLLGDALFELGRVRAADAAYQRMVEVRPDVASYVRVSYALQHHGRELAAIGAMKLALRAAGPAGETAAWVRHQMGDIFAGLGDHKEAARQNRIGMAVAPGYAPPLVGLAESFVARDRLHDAIALMEEAARELPSLEYLTTLGDLYEATGRSGAAEAQYVVVAERLARYRENGVAADADFILFYADHGLRPKATLREAYAVYRNRPTARTADALGWALHSAGRDEEAWRYAGKAMKMAPADSGTLFHAGMIARSMGLDGEGLRLVREALRLDALSPVQARVARSLVARS